MHHLKHPATIISIVALFAALSGSAIASTLISGAQIKNHSIPSNKLTSSAVRQLRGQQGPAGPQGLQGPQGPAGGFNLSSIGYYKGSEVAIAPGTSATATATCPAGKKATGGGFRSDVWYGANSYGSLYTTDEGPMSSGAGWYANLYNSASATDNADVTAYVVCAG